jgi:L-threonylcarbamoyladenylate synthase
MRQCLQALANGGVIACPTEAVWGLSCDPWNDAAIARLLELKHRSAAQGLILVAADASQLAFLLKDLPAALRSKMAVSWPGPNSWLVPHEGRVSPLVHGRHESVAVRVCGHPLVRELCQLWGGVLVSTSANRSGTAAPRSTFGVRRYFGNRLDAVLPGRVGDSPRPSTIREVFSDEVLRA